MKQLLLTALVVWTACGPKERDLIFDCNTDACEDCAVIDRKLEGRADKNFSVDLCLMCQGATCGTSSCASFPCRDGKHVVRACNVDGDCASLKSACGHYTGQHNICVFNDAI